MESVNSSVFCDRDVLVWWSPLGPLVQARMILVVVKGFFVSGEEYFDVQVAVEPIDCLFDRSGTRGEAGRRNELKVEAKYRFGLLWYNFVGS